MTAVPGVTRRGRGGTFLDGPRRVMPGPVASDDNYVPTHRPPPSLKLAGHPPRVADGPGGAEFVAVEKWVAKRLGKVDHERRVAAVAGSMFDLTAGLHDLADSERRLLLLAGLVHDVGRSVDDRNHPAEGAAMLLADSSLPITAQSRRALAYLTLYHRGTVPDVGEDDVLHPDDDGVRLRAVLGFLKAADGLDGRSLPSPQLVFALVAGGQGARRVPELRVTCYIKAESARARQVYTRRKKFRLLEETIGCRVEVDVALAQGLRMVA